MRYQGLLFLAASLMTSSALMANETEPAHSAHQHGIASLSLAVSGNSIEIDLDSPAANIIGFEHPASTDEESAKANHQKDLLEAVDKLFAFNEEALCTLLQTDLNHAQDEAAEHADIVVTYGGRCAGVEQLVTLDMAGLFSTFPALEQINVQWIHDTKQSSTTLTAEHTVLHFK